MKLLRKADRRSQAGQSIFEMALITPVLLALAVGVIEVGRYSYISILVANAARAGAAYGAQSLVRSADTAGISTAAKNDFLNNGQTGLNVSSNLTCGCDSNGVVTAATSCNIVTNPSAGTCASGHWVVQVNVTASGTFNSMFKYPVVPQSLALSSTNSMRVAQE